MNMQIELPYPPSVNHYYRRVGAKTLISRQGREYREDVCGILLAANLRPLKGDLVLTMAVYPPDRRRRDVDNVLKAALDAMQHGGAYLDDSQIKELHVRMMAPVPSGKAIVTLARLKALGGVASGFYQRGGSKGLDILPTMPHIKIVARPR